MTAGLKKKKIRAGPGRPDSVDRLPMTAGLKKKKIRAGPGSVRRLPAIPIGPNSPKSRYSRFPPEIGRNLNGKGDEIEFKWTEIRLGEDRNTTQQEETKNWLSFRRILRSEISETLAGKRDFSPRFRPSQAVLAAVSRVLSRRRHDTQKREPPSAAAGILPSARLHLLRSSPLSRARPIFLRFTQVQPVRPSSSPSETTRPSLSPDLFSLTRKSARNKRIQTHGPVRPSSSLSRPNAPFRSPVSAHSAQLSGAWPSLPAQYPSSRSELCRPPPAGSTTIFPI
ncbi:hypothetical protein CRG98_043515 [Punica granatum]|uniref:Uncharacterized protein n=1 Tax=Punica granatum TaxID=22663 RepID=A0A2I0HWU5_PUNGR|nr:hypothetical protein CRG98_043515 [Punica granatum]